MRTRSRLMSKRRLQLPTIKEGAEETLRDMNSADHAQPPSPDDYFLSICHLASPTFPSQDPAPDIISARQMDALHQRLRFPRHGGNESVTLEVRRGEKDEHVRHLQQGEWKDLNGHHGNSDPLEYLYGRQRAPSEGRRRGDVWGMQACSRAYSVPRASSPDLPRQRKSSCPELPTTSGGAPSDLSPKRPLPRSEARTGGPRDRDTEAESRGPAVKHSLISQWFSDCRSAWREARVRAPVLPAIAEL